MTIWEYFSEAVKCNSSVLLQNCQLISEDMQNTNKPALLLHQCHTVVLSSGRQLPQQYFVMTLLTPSRDGRRVSMLLEGRKAMWNTGERFRHESTRQQETQSGAPVGDTQLSAKNGHRPASSWPCPQCPSQTHILWPFLLSYLLHGILCPLQLLNHDLPQSFSSQVIYLFARITPCCGFFASRF